MWQLKTNRRNRCWFFHYQNHYLWYQLCPVPKQAWTWKRLIYWFVTILIEKVILTIHKDKIEVRWSKLKRTESNLVLMSNLLHTRKPLRILRNMRIINTVERPVIKREFAKSEYKIKKGRRITCPTMVVTITIPITSKEDGMITHRIISKTPT